MKIVGGEVWEVRIALDEPYSIAYATFDDAPNIFIQLETNTGLVGYGSANPDFEVTGETPASVRDTLVDIVGGALRGADPFRREAILRELQAACPNQPAARAAVDMALLDLIGKAERLPVWRLLGGFRDSIETDVTIGIAPVADAVWLANKWVAEGFRCLKVKGGQDVAEDLERVHAIRQAVGPAIELRFDANQGYTIESALRFSREASLSRIAFLEQPTLKERIDWLASLSQSVELPIMADESALDSRDALALVRQSAVTMLNIKLMKCGGLLEAARIAAITEAAGITAMVGCMDESVLGIAAGLHFACACGSVTLADLDGHLGMANDPARQGFERRGGILTPLDLPGFGVEVTPP